LAYKAKNYDDARRLAYEGANIFEGDYARHFASAKIKANISLAKSEQDRAFVNKQLERDGRSAYDSLFDEYGVDRRGNVDIVDAIKQKIEQKQSDSAFVKRANEHIRGVESVRGSIATGSMKAFVKSDNMAKTEAYNALLNTKDYNDISIDQIDKLLDQIDDAMVNDDVTLIDEQEYDFLQDSAGIEDVDKKIAELKAMAEKEAQSYVEGRNSLLTDYRSLTSKTITPDKKAEVESRYSENAAKENMSVTDYIVKLGKECNQQKESIEMRFDKEVAELKGQKIANLEHDAKESDKKFAATRESLLKDYGKLSSKNAEDIDYLNRTYGENAANENMSVADYIVKLGKECNENRKANAAQYEERIARAKAEAGMDVSESKQTTTSDGRIHGSKDGNRITSENQGVNSADVQMMGGIAVEDAENPNNNNNNNNGQHGGLGG
jgi:hypothetical protein